jgi:hypothetical protein
MVKIIILHTPLKSGINEGIFFACVIYKKEEKKTGWHQHFSVFLFEAKQKEILFFFKIFFDGWSREGLVVAENNISKVKSRKERKRNGGTRRFNKFKKLHTENHGVGGSSRKKKKIHNQKRRGRFLILSLKTCCKKSGKREKNTDDVIIIINGTRRERKKIMSIPYISVLVNACLNTRNIIINYYY